MRKNTWGWEFIVGWLLLTGTFSLDRTFLWNILLKEKESTMIIILLYILELTLIFHYHAEYLLQYLN